jgi:carbonic anhydrase/acetyltransferase-like protein (isoleucine patch superfamily)
VTGCRTASPLPDQLHRVVAHCQDLRRGIRIRYFLALGITYLVPTFTASPIVVVPFRRVQHRRRHRVRRTGAHLAARASKNLDIGRNALISMNVTIKGRWSRADQGLGQHQHLRQDPHRQSPIGPGSHRMMGEVSAKPVTIERGAWIGVGALILPGVTVGHGSIVGAGSVVNADVPPNTLVEGNPAKVVRALPWGDR